MHLIESKPMTQLPARAPSVAQNFFVALYRDSTLVTVLKGQAQPLNLTTAVVSGVCATCTLELDSYPCFLLGASSTTSGCLPEGLQGKSQPSMASMLMPCVRTAYIMPYMHGQIAIRVLVRVWLRLWNVHKAGAAPRASTHMACVSRPTPCPTMSPGS